MEIKIKNYIQISILLILFILMIFGLFFVGILYLSFRFHDLFISTLISLLILIVLYILCMSYILLNSYKKGSVNRGLYKSLKIFSNMIFPWLNFVAKLFNIERQGLKGFFIEINNILTASKRYKFEANDILLIAPHCLQNSSCNVKITNNASNCKKCGKCQIKDLLELSEKYNNKFYVVSGGTFARKVVADISPKFIISVACERDLLSGIQDIKSIPVIGIINLRPNGPCSNTKVDVSKVEEVIKSVIIRGR